MRKLLLILAVVNIILSCKRGEDDPWLSMRSREQRLIGKWKLAEEQINIEDYNSKGSNYVYKGGVYNNDVLYYSGITTISVTPTQINKEYNGIEKKNALILYGDTVNVLDSTTKSIKSFSKIDSTASGTYEIIVDIKKQNEYTQTENKELSIRYKEKNWGVAVFSFDCGNTVYTPYNDSLDNNFIINSKKTFNGKWQWVNDKKTKINAGYMQGNILRLSNNEIIISNEYNTETFEKMPYNNYVHLNYHIYCFNAGVIPIISPVKYNYCYVKNVKKHKVYQRWERIKE